MIMNRLMIIVAFPMDVCWSLILRTAQTPLSEDGEEKNAIEISLCNEQEIDAQIENLLSAKRTVKAMDGTST